MIDLNILLNDFEAAAARLELKNFDRSELERLRDLSIERKALVKATDDYRRNTNVLSAKIKEIFQSPEKDMAEVERLKAASAKNKEDLKASEAKLREVEAAWRELHLGVPNFPHAEAPVGKTEEDNVVVRHVGYNPEDFEGKTFRPHWEIGEELGILDTETAAKITGSMFTMFRGQGAQLLRALVNYGLDLNRDDYLEIVPPHFVNSATFTATGHLPKFADDAYNIEGEDLWVIPTGEVPLTGMGRDKIYDHKELPLRFMAYTSCFRKEAGSAGKDTRGVQRLHEFHKLEMLKYCTAENVYDEWVKMVGNAERLLQNLKLPYRILNLCTGDLTFSSEMVYDLEVYSAGVGKWLEVSSVGIFGDFQARRGNIRYRGEDGKLHFVHLLNGSAVATPRVWAGIIENYQQPDGTVLVPEVLQKYMGTDRIG